MFCENCGKQIDLSVGPASHCPHCGTQIAGAATTAPRSDSRFNATPRQAPAPPQSSASPVFCESCGRCLEDGQAVCPYCDSDESESLGGGGGQRLGGITLSKDEVVVRTYQCSALRFPKCTGYVSVTNQRVLFHGHSFNSRIVDEVQLDSVSGISTFYGGKIRVGRLIFGALLSLFAITTWIGSAGSSSNPFSSSFSLATLLPPGFMPIVFLGGLVLLCCCFRKVFFLKIYSSKANNSPIAIGEGYGGLGGNSAVYSVSAYPTEQTDKMMLELGAMIGDLQRTGDYGVAQWKQ